MNKKMPIFINGVGSFLRFLQHLLYSSKLYLTCCRYENVCSINTLSTFFLSFVVFFPTLSLMTCPRFFTCCRYKVSSGLILIVTPRESADLLPRNNGQCDVYIIIINPSPGGFRCVETFTRRLIFQSRADFCQS